ncbi:MAG: hypothetical protein IJJ55_03070, partial [Clostridia bacterium]|nr:hypothetical protein [Clostridia bacterium]
RRVTSISRRFACITDFFPTAAYYTAFRLDFCSERALAKPSRYEYFAQICVHNGLFSDRRVLRHFG